MNKVKQKRFKKGNTLVLTVVITLLISVTAAICFTIVYKYAKSSEDRESSLRYTINSTYSLEESGG